MAQKGVIVEYDFAAMDGAKILFDTMQRFLRTLDNIPFDAVAEAKYLAGGNYQGAFAEYFPVVKTKKTAQKAGKDFDAFFRQTLATHIPTSLAAGFRNFVKTLAEKGVKVVIATRAEIMDVGATFADLVGENVMLYHEASTTYGNVKWDCWRRACVAAKLRPLTTLAVTGSGNGVKSALLAGLPSLAVVNDRVAYQDFSGADAVVDELNAAAAKAALSILRI